MSTKGVRPSVPRMLPLESNDISADVLSKVVFDSEGQPLTIFNYLANNEQLLRRFNSLGAHMRTSTATALTHREVIVLRIAFLADCTFEYDQHVEIARSSGVDEGTILASRQPNGRPGNHIDQILFAIADDIFRQDVVSEAAWNLASQVWGPDQLIELVMTAGFFRMAASTINSIGLRTRETW
jgi:4-carboxymuconolactone decarboxylase